MIGICLVSKIPYMSATYPNQKMEGAKPNCVRACQLGCTGDMKDDRTFIHPKRKNNYILLQSTPLPQRRPTPESNLNCHLIDTAESEHLLLLINMGNLIIFNFFVVVIRKSTLFTIPP